MSVGALKGATSAHDSLLIRQDWLAHSAQNQSKRTQVTHVRARPIADQPNEPTTSFGLADVHKNRRYTIAPKYRPQQHPHCLALGTHLLSLHFANLSVKRTNEWCRSPLD